jgi:hypothetical protein
MMENARLSADGNTIIVKIPMKFRRRGGRKLIIAPDGGDAWMPSKPRRDDTLIKAIARARRWQRMLESGQVPSTRQLAEKEKINASYLARILRLTLLAPDIVEAILDGRQPKGLLLADLMKTFPVEWDRQRTLFGFSREPS